MSEERENPQAEQATPGEGAETTEEPTAPDTIRLQDGTEVSSSQIEHWRSRAKNLEAGFNKKREDMNREFEQKVEEAVAARLAQSRGPGADADEPSPDFSSLDEYLPGLGQAFGTFSERMTRIEKAQSETRDASRQFLESADRETAWEKVLGEYDGTVFAKPDEMRALMENRGLDPTPENAELVYHALYGFRAGEASEVDRMRKVKETPSPMVQGGTSGLSANFAEEAVPRSKKPLHETSFEELRDRAMKDPRARKFLVNR